MTQHLPAADHTQVVCVQGHLEAAYQLGVMFLNGWGVGASRTQALYYWTLAANYGHVLAMHNLAMLHLGSPCASADCHVLWSAGLAASCQHMSQAHLDKLQPS